MSALLVATIVFMIVPINSVVAATISLLTCILESVNYFASDATGNDKAFPTITVLVDPIVASNTGKLGFILLWSLAGAGLLRVSTKK